MTDIPALHGSLVLPRIEAFAAQPVLVRHARLTMAEIDSLGPALLGEVLDGLAARGIAEAGPAFFRYDLINMAGQMGMAFGVQVPPGTEGFGEVRAEVLPAGRYLTALHRGHPDELYDCMMMIVPWAKGRRIRWDSEMIGVGERFAARLEFYRSDPQTVPMNDWETEIRIKVAG
jgi:hypothetical protein